MLSFHTQNRLAQLFQSIADGERKIEVIRQVLAAVIQFEPYTAFKRIDRQKNGWISTTDIQEFLQENDIYINSKDVFSILRKYDLDLDGKITFLDFNNIVLPKEDQILRIETQKRKPYIVAIDEFLPYEIEWGLARLFEQEVKNFKQQELLRELLVQAHDFGLKAGFQVIDQYGKGFVTQQQMDRFMQASDCPLSVEELDALFRAVDLDDDGVICYQEYVQAVLPNDPYPRSLVRTYQNDDKAYEERVRNFNQSAIRAQSASEKQYHQQQQQSQYISKMPYTSAKKKLSDEDYQDYLYRTNSFEKRQSAQKKVKIQSEKLIEKSPEKKLSKPKQAIQFSSAKKQPRLCYSVEKKKNQQSGSNYKQNQNESQYYKTPNKSAQKFIKDQYYQQLSSNVKSQIYKSPIKQNEEEQLILTLKEQIQIDRDLEKCKQKLSLRSDFNLLDGFRLLDFKARGFVTNNEFLHALQSLGLNPTRDQIYLFFRRYDKDNDGLLKYSDFCKIVQPQDQSYSKVLNDRGPLFLDERDEDTFTNETRILFKTLLNYSINAEVAAESLRQKLINRPLFSIHEAFQVLDLNSQGFITLNEFKEIFTEYGIFCNKHDLINLMKRYDKNQDGKISYTEFINELTPKSPIKYQ